MQKTVSLFGNFTEINLIVIKLNLLRRPLLLTLFVQKRIHGYRVIKIRIHPS
jgi:hypothetical protein